MTTEDEMIKLRVDVDYPYPSRIKSFLCVALKIRRKLTRDYLRNARVIAAMINESKESIKAYWFFTPYTIPDQELLKLLDPEKHEVALHVATDPYGEWKSLQEKTGRTIQYYTIHGTSRWLARLIWGRKHGQKQAQIPTDFPLKSFHNFETFSLDTICSQLNMEEAKDTTVDWVNRKVVISIHPEWLLKGNKKNQRGAYYEALKSMLQVDAELETVSLNRRHGVKVARDFHEYEKDVIPTENMILKIAARGADIFTFVERRWSCPIANPPSMWKRENDNVGLLKLKDYQSWWNEVGKKTRNMVRKAERSGISVAAVEPSEELAKGIWLIYNETPIRQGRAFPHYGESLETVSENMYASKKATFVAAKIEEEIVGFVQILYGDNIAIISNILSMQQHQDKAVNNALLAKAVEICASKGTKWLMYGRIGNHPSLDKFKENNGFVKYPLFRFYIPITSKGRLAILLGLHQELKDALPPSVKEPLIPAFSWTSRNMEKLKHALYR